MFVSEFRLSPGGVYIPFVRDGGELVQVAMAPMAGAQEAFLMAPEREVGICGNRGGGKTQIMLVDALSGVGRGFGSNYKAILIRRSQREMTDIITLSESLIRPIWPKACHRCGRSLTMLSPAVPTYVGKADVVGKGTERVKRLQFLAHRSLLR